MNEEFKNFDKFINDPDWNKTYQQIVNECMEEGLKESLDMTPEREKEIDEAAEAFLKEYNRISIEGTEEEMEAFLNEGMIGAILGGLTGFALGKSLGKALAKVLGIEKGILYDLLTSRLVGAALGASLGKRI